MHQDVRIQYEQFCFAGLAGGAGQRRLFRRFNQFFAGWTGRQREDRSWSDGTGHRPGPTLHACSGKGWGGVSTREEGPGRALWWGFLLPWPPEPVHAPRRRFSFFPAAVRCVASLGRTTDPGRHLHPVAQPATSVQRAERGHARCARCRVQGCGGRSRHPLRGARCTGQGIFRRA